MLHLEANFEMEHPALNLDDHPLLEAGWFCAEFEKPISELSSPDWLVELLSLEASAPVASGDETRKAVRDLLRHGGHKPAGRGKPASEFLHKAASNAGLGSINLPVDLCNAASLHSA